MMKSLAFSPFTFSYILSTKETYNKWRCYNAQQNRVMLQMTQFHCEFSSFIRFVVVLMYIGTTQALRFISPTKSHRYKVPNMFMMKEILLWTTHHFKLIMQSTKCHYMGQWIWLVLKSKAFHYILYYYQSLQSSVLMY